MVPASEGTINFSVRGKATSVVYIEIDGQIWRRYEIDFVNSNVQFAAGSYIPANRPTEAPTEPEIVPPPYEEEPTETEYVPSEEPTTADDDNGDDTEDGDE